MTTSRSAERPDQAVPFWVRTVAVGPPTLGALIAGPAFLVFPTSTAVNNGWGVNPLSAISLGAFFSGVSVAGLATWSNDSWHRLRVNLYALIPFLVLGLVASVQHRDTLAVRPGQSALGTLLSLIWVPTFAVSLVGAIAGIVIPVVSVRQRGIPPRLVPDARLPQIVAVPLTIGGVVAVVFGAFLYVRGGLAEELAPWLVGPLERQMLGAVSVGLGVSAVVTSQSSNRSHLIHHSVMILVTSLVSVAALFVFPGEVLPTHKWVVLPYIVFLAWAVALYAAVLVILGALPTRRRRGLVVVPDEP